MQFEAGRTFLGRTSQTWLTFIGFKDYDVLLANNDNYNDEFMYRYSVYCTWHAHWTLCQCRFATCCTYKITVYYTNIFQLLILCYFNSHIGL